MKHVVGFSGGADSQACAGWVLDHFPKEDVILMNTEAGRNEHPITVEFIQWYSQNVHPVVCVVPLVKDLGTRGTKPGKCRDRRQEFSDNDELTFDGLAYIKGVFPSRKKQFCTEHLKLAPQKRWCDENLVAKGIDFERYTGVRRDESDKRKGTPDSEWDTYFDTTVHHPIASWTKDQVFDFIKKRGEQFNPLYQMGFSRVGCAPCVNSGKDDIRNWAARFPEMIDKVRSWEKKNGRTFFPPMIPPSMEYRKALAAWKSQWLIAGEPDDDDDEVPMIVKDGAPPPPDKPINWIDEVVEWSKTERGGKVIALPYFEAEVAAGGCMSKYKLCE